MWASDPDSPELSRVEERARRGADSLLLKPQRSVLRPVLSPDRGPVASSQDPLEGNRGARDMGEWGGEAMSTTSFKKKKKRKRRIRFREGEGSFGSHSLCRNALSSSPVSRLCAFSWSPKGNPSRFPSAHEAAPASAGRPRAPLEGKGAGTAGAWVPLPDAQPALPSMRLPRCTSGRPQSPAPPGSHRRVSGRSQALSGAPDPRPRDLMSVLRPPQRWPSAFPSSSCHLLAPVPTPPRPAPGAALAAAS